MSEIFFRYKTPIYARLRRHAVRGVSPHGRGMISSEVPDNMYSRLHHLYDDRSESKVQCSCAISMMRGTASLLSQIRSCEHGTKAGGSTSNEGDRNTGEGGCHFCHAFATGMPVSGGAEEDRTPDLRIANATLSQLSYRPILTDSIDCRMPVQVSAVPPTAGDVRRVMKKHLQVIESIDGNSFGTL
ncbi:MAG: hypothetical protein V7606_1242 [Burkholderiales bacterium]